MNSPFPLSNKNLSMIGAHWGWFFLLSIALIILGVVAVGASVFTTLITMVFLGVIITIGGVVLLIDCFKSWWGKGGAFWLHLLLSILYIAAGSMLIENPVLGSMSITFVLGIFYTFVGVSRLVSSVSWKMPHWGWSFFNGLITLILGILILANWPASSLFIIGMFVGIDLIFAGWTYMMISLAAKKFANK